MRLRSLATSSGRILPFILWLAEKRLNFLFAHPNRDAIKEPPLSTGTGPKKDSRKGDNRERVDKLSGRAQPRGGRRNEAVGMGQGREWRLPVE